jgi:hypothetical protein
MIYGQESKALSKSTNLATMKHKFQNSNGAKILARHDIVHQLWVLIRLHKVYPILT